VPIVASQKSHRRSRKRRGAAPRAVASERREHRAARLTASSTERAPRRPEGERPASPFGGVPVAEIAILAGLVALLVWWIRGGTAVLVVGLVVCALGVLEVTTREHFSGYRSHTTLLSAVPAIALAIGVISLTGADRRERAVLMVVIAGPVFALLSWLLRKRFTAARQARARRLTSPDGRP
jgi:hypothetical protein